MGFSDHTHIFTAQEPKNMAEDEPQTAEKFADILAGSKLSPWDWGLQAAPPRPTALPGFHPTWVFTQFADKGPSRLVFLPGALIRHLFPAGLLCQSLCHLVFQVLTYSSAWQTPG